MPLQCGCLFITRHSTAHLHGPAARTQLHLPHSAALQLLQSVWRDVCACQLLHGPQQHARAVQRHVADAAHCHRLHPGQVHRQVLLVRVAIVPPHKLARGKDALAVLRGARTAAGSTHHT
jgi:hypothetical protein